MQYIYNRQHFIGLIFLLMVLSIVTWSIWTVLVWIKYDYCLPLSWLVITGECNYTTNNDIRRSILALGPMGTFITQDVNLIQEEIEHLPWIKQVSVRKRWPDELKIHILEYKPIALWNDVYMLDSCGVIFSMPVELVKRQLPVLRGPEGSEQDLLSVYHIFNEVLQMTELQLKMVNMSARRSWQVILQNDIRLELGRSDIVKRLRRFVKYYPIVLQQSMKKNMCINYVDLRYDAGFAVGWM